MLPTLLNELFEETTLRIQMAAQFPPNAVYRFDRDSSDSDSHKQFEAESTEPYWPAQKLLRRVLVSLRFSRFHSKEVVREQESKEGKTLLHHSPQLEAVVPKGHRYCYDLIAHVGLETFVNGRKLQAVHQELSDDERRRLQIPFSSFYDVQYKFLFYFGELHRQAATVLKEYLHEQGPITWIIDGTLEPGTAVFFGVKEPEEGFMLASWKIATENADEIADCLRETGRQYGWPTDVLHDLSDAMDRACEAALPEEASHRVCDYHLSRDIGEDLYQAPQAALSKLVRSLKLQVRLKEQRRGQTKWLRERIESPEDSLALSDLLAGKIVQASNTELLGREILLAFHQWILDYASDGRRQGFPFDPYLLYFHRRVVKAQGIVEKLLSKEVVRSQAPKVLTNFSQMLREHVTNPKVLAAATHYEKAWTLFEELRNALRLCAKGPSPMRHAYRLAPGEQPKLAQALTELRKECEEKSESDSDPEQRELCQIVVAHLERYWPHIIAASGLKGTRQTSERTTTKLEGHWGHGKQRRRQAHGRKRLTLDFQALPQEYMLVPNLENLRYVELVLGSLDQLPKRLAEAGKTAGPFTHWLEKRRPLNLGRLPKRVIRDENLVDNLVDTYDAQCELLLQ